MTDAAFAHLLDVQRVEIHVDAANLASARIPEKLGYRRVRTEQREKLALAHTGEGYVWQVSRDEWPGQQGHWTMALQLLPEETRFGNLRTVTTPQLAGEVEAHVPAGLGRPPVVAIDGRSGSGKSTIARAIATAVDGTTVVSTDDLAWHHSFFGWADLLTDGVLEKVRRPEDVDFRPPAWVARNRPGSIRVPASSRLVVIEGVGAARLEAAAFTDLVIWVQSDVEQARHRCLTREAHDPDAEAFWNEWMAEEIPFLARHRPWERADLVVVNDDRLTPDPGRAIQVTAWRTDSAG
jgi:hypothetical protein